MKYTSSEANKLLKKLNADYQTLLALENQSRTFLAATGEDVESVRPAYDYAKTQADLKALAKKIAKAKPLTLPGELDSYGDLTLKFGANGVVTVKGAGASSSSVLVPFSDEPTEFRLFAYLPPKKSFPGYAARITLKWDGTNLSL